MDYKDTLLMPKTAFKMRGGLVNKEPKMQQLWDDIDLYNKKLQLNKCFTTARRMPTVICIWGTH